MKFTLKENINTESFVLKHDILLQASSLIMGREGVLQTEKDLYLVIAFVDNLVVEDVIGLCNTDNRDLSTIVANDIEPFFFKLIQEEKYHKLYNEMRELHLQRCKEIWDNQHSIIGVIDTILTTIATMSDEDKKDALVETAKIAEAAFDRRTKVMHEEAEKTNSKLEEFIKNYKIKIEEQKNENGDN